MMNDAKLNFASLMKQNAYGKPAKNLKKSLIKHQDKLWHYIEQKSVPATNNSSEQALRNVKVKQKISTCMRTLRGAQIFCKLRSIAETCRKQGKSFFRSLLQISEPCYSTGWVVTNFIISCFFLHGSLKPSHSFISQEFRTFTEMPIFFSSHFQRNPW